jgi:hypothetical protein
MRRMMAGAAIALLAGCSLGADLPVAKAEADKFHRMFDAGQCAEIYRGAGPDLTGAITAADWATMCNGLHAKLGKFKSAADPGWLDQWNNGTHQFVLNYESEYEKGAAKEEFVFRTKGDKLMLAGYHVSSDALFK